MYWKYSIFSVASTGQKSVQVAYRSCCCCCQSTFVYIGSLHKGLLSWWPKSKQIWVFFQLDCHTCCCYLTASGLSSYAMCGSLSILPFTEATFNCSYLMDVFKRLRWAGSTTMWSTRYIIWPVYHPGWCGKTCALLAIYVVAFWLTFIALCRDPSFIMECKWCHMCLCSPFQVIRHIKKIVNWLNS